MSTPISHHSALLCPGVNEQPRLAALGGLLCWDAFGNMGTLPLVYPVTEGRFVIIAGPQTGCVSI